MQVGCKHAVALIIAARELALTGGVTPEMGADTSAQTPAWERTLRAVAAAAPPRASPRRHRWRSRSASCRRDPGGASIAPARLPASVRPGSCRRRSACASSCAARRALGPQHGDVGAAALSPPQVRLDPAQRSRAMRLRELHGRDAGWSHASIRC